MIHSKSASAVFSVLLMLVLLPACNRGVETAAVKGQGVAPRPASAMDAPSPQVKVEAIPPANSAPASKAVVLESSTPGFEDVFFDFDKSTLRVNAGKELEEDAKVLKDHPGMKVRIEGYCDERGTEEYNLALGNRRAEAVKRYLAALGVDPSRLTTISYGKEKPFCTEYTEDCYQKNRRVQIVKMSTGS